MGGEGDVLLGEFVKCMYWVRCWRDLGYLEGLRISPSIKVHQYRQINTRRPPIFALSFSKLREPGFGPRIDGKVIAHLSLWKTLVISDLATQLDSYSGCTDAGMHVAENCSSSSAHYSRLEMLLWL